MARAWQTHKKMLFIERDTQQKKENFFNIFFVHKLNRNFGRKIVVVFSEHAEKYAMRDLKGAHTPREIHTQPTHTLHTQRISWGWLGLLSRRLSAHYQSDAASVFDMASLQLATASCDNDGGRSHTQMFSHYVMCVCVSPSVSVCVRACRTDPGSSLSQCFHHLSTSSVSHENLLLRIVRNVAIDDVKGSLLFCMCVCVSVCLSVCC